MNYLPCVNCSKQPSGCKCDYYVYITPDYYKGKSKSYKFWMDKVPTAIFYCLPLIAGLFLFGEGFDKSKAIHNNDGPIGYMNSAHMNPYGPGIAVWNDLNWIGIDNNGYVHPINLSNVLIWALHVENMPIVIFGLLFIYCLGKYIDLFYRVKKTTKVKKTTTT